MNIETQLKIKNNPYIHQYLRDNSIWYKRLNRDPNSIKELEKEMKSAYKLNVVDKIDNINQKIEMLRTFIDILN